MPDVAVSADDVTLSYRTFPQGRTRTLRSWVSDGFRMRQPQTITAVRHVTFEVYRGEAVGVIGHNGSGKSTLLRGLAGLLPVDSGQVSALSPPVLLGVSSALNPRLSGRRNVMLGATALGLSAAEARAAMADIIGFAELGEFIDLPLSTYSSGMKARLQFAIATAVTPDILLVDEALAVGDARFREKSNLRMRRMLKDAGTVMLVSHSPGAIRQMCSRVLWMDHGRLVDSGPTDVMLDAYKRAMAG